MLRHFIHLKFETVTKWGGVEWDDERMEGANAPAIAQSICAPAAETRRTINGSLTVQLKLTFFAFPISFRSSSYFLLNKYTLYIVGAPAPEHTPLPSNVQHALPLGHFVHFSFR